jgi:hypothetical protein
MGRRRAWLPGYSAGQTLRAGWELPPHSINRWKDWDMFKKTSYEGMYNAFREISRLVHSSRTSEEVLQRVVWKSSELVRAKGALLRIHNPETRQFEVAAAYGLGERYLSKGPVSNESILADLDGPDKVVVIRDVWDAPRVEYP